MTFIGALTDVVVAAADLDQPGDRFVLVVDGRGREIEMEAVRARLPFGDGLEDDLESGAIRRHERDVIGVLVVDSPAQSLGPKAREAEGIIRIEAEGVQPRSHA
jgi:hypothetical protein